MPHEGVRRGPRGSRGAPRCVGETLEGGCAPDLSCLMLPDAGMRAHGCRWWATPCRTTLIRAPSCRSAGIDTGAGGDPHPHHDAHRGATGRTVGRERGRGHALWWPAIAGMALYDQEAAGRERDGTAGMEQAEVADFHKAIGQDMLEEPAETLSAVEAGGAEAGTAHCPGGERHGTIREADETVGGDGHREDIRGEGR